MKKFLFLMAILPMMLLTACSSDDDKTNDYESALVGSWVEDTNSTREVFHLDLKADHTGSFWATDDGVINNQGKQSLVWSATDTKITTTFNGKETESVSYQIVNRKLYLGEIVYVRK